MAEVLRRGRGVLDRIVSISGLSGLFGSRVVEFGVDWDDLEPARAREGVLIPEPAPGIPLVPLPLVVASDETVEVEGG